MPPSLGVEGYRIRVCPSMAVINGTLRGCQRGASPKCRPFGRRLFHEMQYRPAEAGMARMEQEHDREREGR
jgi:hypothetical protein